MEEDWENEAISFALRPKEEIFETKKENITKRFSGRGRLGLSRQPEMQKPGKLDENNNQENEKTFGFSKVENTNMDELNDEKGFDTSHFREETVENWNAYAKQDAVSKNDSELSNEKSQYDGKDNKSSCKLELDENFNYKNQEFNNKNESKEFSFNQKIHENDGQDEEYKFNKGFGNKDRFENREGESRGFNKGFGNKDRFENREGESRGFNKGLRNRDRYENGEGESRGFNKGFGNKDRFENGEGENRGFNKGFRNGYGGRDKSSGDGERAPFRKRNDQNEGFGKDKNEVETVKKEKYIPTEVDETEESLFTTVAAGVNFKKQIDIKTDLSGNGSDDIKPLSSFDEADFSELLLKNIKKTKYNVPTAVQKYSMPIILKRRDLMACAQTGSGKTAAFVLPILKNIIEDGIESSQLSGLQQPQALILSPTRELALQIYHECKKFSHGSIIQTEILYGGVHFSYQMDRVGKGVNVLVATPGRLLHVIEKESDKISLEKVKYFVLDEADRMLDMGFEKAVRDILEKGKVKEKNDRCTFMFSATFPDEIQRLAQDFLNDYLFLAVGQVGGANTDVEQTIHKVTKFEKRQKCIEILDQIGNERTMIFMEHKKEVDVNAFFLTQKGYPSTSIHGDRLQSQRESALRDFKNGSKTILVCTAVAARGLDIEKVNHVINFDLPSTIDEYVHRIGRTGRCGNLGKSISFFDPESENDQKLARPLVRILSQACQNVPEWLNSFSEHSISTSTNSNSTDLRSKFDRLSFDSNPTFSSSQPVEEESWDN